MNKWIPTSEQLPEELRGVLVYCPLYKNIFCAYLENNKWMIFSPIGLEELEQEVIAWMTLPEPYKENKDA